MQAENIIAIALQLLVLLFFYSHITILFRIEFYQDYLYIKYSNNMFSISATCYVIQNLHMFRRRVSLDRYIQSLTNQIVHKNSISISS